MRGNSSGIDTTVQRMAAPSFWNSIAVKHVRSQRLPRIFDRDRDIKQRREALAHEELAQLTTHKDGDRDDLLRCDSSRSRAWNLETSGFWSLGVGHW
jgi:hypothetical protein